MNIEADRGGDKTRSGDDLLQALSALSSPYRLRIIAALVGRRQYVSQLAREIGMSRPLLHMHLRRLQSAGLVESTLELSDEGKAMNYLSVAPFAIHLTPEAIGQAVQTLTTRAIDSKDPRRDAAPEDD